MNKSIIPPYTTSAELDQLLKTESEAIKKAIASHPNTAIQTLSNLFCTYPTEVLKNPALDLILLSKPDFLEKCCKSCQEINELAKLPEYFLQWMCDRGSVSMRTIIAENHYLPLKFIQKLAQDKNNIIRAYIAATICICDVVLEWDYGKKI